MQGLLDLYKNNLHKRCFYPTQKVNDRLQKELKLIIDVKIVIQRQVTIGNKKDFNVP